MGTANTELPALPYKDRRGWLIGIGIIEILLGILSLLMATPVLVGTLLFQPPPTAQMPAGAGIVSLVIGIGFYALIAAFLFVAGIGSMQRRNWARILMLIVSGFWLAFGTLGTIFIVLLLPKIMETQHVAPMGSMRVEQIVSGAVIGVEAVFGNLVPLAFLIFYSRKSVKATCLARESAERVRAAEGEPAPVEDSSPKLPVPVIILVVWEAFTAVSSLSILVSPLHATVFFGQMGRGWTAIWVMLTLAALSALAAWLMYRMRLVGWTLALLKVLLFAASAITSVASGSITKLFVEVGESSGQLLSFQLLQHLFRLTLVFSAILFAAYLALLIYTRKYFVLSNPPAAVS